jgi:hypothetical protein
METLLEELDEEHVRWGSLELFDDRQEVGQRSDRLEGRCVFRSEGTPGGGEDKGCSDNVQRHLLVEEAPGEASVVLSWPVRCVWQLDVALEDRGDIPSRIDGVIWWGGA